MPRRTELPRDVLTAKLLLAIQHISGMAGVREVGVSEIDDPEEDGNWRVTVVDPGNVVIEQASHAAAHVQEDFRKSYCLRSTEPSHDAAASG
jgi:hypothetical protein